VVGLSKERVFSASESQFYKGSGGVDLFYGCITAMNSGLF
jgi:hypothetical protein